MFALLDACSLYHHHVPRIVFPGPVKLRRWDSIEPTLVQFLVRLETCILQCFDPQKTTNSFFNLERGKSD